MKPVDADSFVGELLLLVIIVFDLTRPGFSPTAGRLASISDKRVATVSVVRTTSSECSKFGKDSENAGNWAKCFFGTTTKRRKY